MSIDKAKELLKQAMSELSEEDSNLSTDNAIYQIYCVCNSVIANEIKRIIREEGFVTKEHADIKPLYNLFESLLPVMLRYSAIVRSQEESKEILSSFRQGDF